MHSAADQANIARNLYRYDKVHRPVADPGSINEQHLEQFRRDGFLAVENVFTPREIDDAKAGLRFLIGGGKPDFEGLQFEKGAPPLEGLTPDEREPYVRKLMYFVNHEPRLKHMSQHPTLVGLVERLVGSAVNMVQDMALLKPPHVGREKPWHQDTAYFLYEPLDGILGTWTALDAATAENGCMHVIPGSHLRGPKPHYHDRDCQIPDDLIDVQNDVIVPLKPGGVMLFSGLLQHGTPPNQSSAPRRALQFHYLSIHCRKIDEDRHGKLFGDAGGYAGCTAWPPKRTIKDRVF